MKSLIILVFSVLTGLALSAQAQDQGTIPKISQQLSEYYSYYPKENVFVMTEKSLYRPGETLWFRAFVSNANNFPVSVDTQKLFVKLYNSDGKSVVQDIFRITEGVAPGDLLLPEDLPASQYFLVAYTAANRFPELISCTPIRIDPQYSNQLVAKTQLQDSLSIAGKKNQLSVTLFDILGEVQNNTTVRYQFRNGSEVLDKGKVKTDSNGLATIELSVPEKTNGEPFVCELSDARNNWKQEVWLPTNIDPLVVHFYPEGGNMVAGIPAKIGFTAYNKWGIPVDIEGTINNQDGKTVSLFKTFTKGLGLFTLVNDGMQNYKLVIAGKSGQNQSFEVPATSSSELSLTVVKTDTAFISANFIFADKQKHSIAMVISRAGNLYWAADMEINSSSRIKIPTENLPQGINLLSVFSNKGQLLAERVLFTDKNHELNIDIQPDKASLKQNESMKVKVRLMDENNQPISGNVAVTVSDKFRNVTKTEEIDKYLQIGSVLETPFSLISDVFKGRISNTALLDVFLITNRIKGFDWEKVMKFKPGNATDVGILNNEIKGQVTDKNGNKVAKAKVSLVNSKNMQLYSTSTNDDGMFSFPNLNASATEDFTAKATEQDGKHDLNVTFSKNFEGQISEFIQKMSLNYMLTDKVQMADEDYLKSNPFLFQKPPKADVSKNDKLDNQRRLLESSTNVMDVIKNIKSYKIVNNQIVFPGTENSLLAQGGALIVVDGQKMGTDISSITNISPMEVDHINVSTNVIDIQRYTGLNSVGIIEIFLKKGKPIESNINLEPVNKYNGEFRVPNEFSAEPVNKKNNTATSLLWIPEQKVDNTGQFEFTLTAGKVISDFVIEVQGISNNGRLGSGMTEFSVIK